MDSTENSSEVALGGRAPLPATARAQTSTRAVLDFRATNSDLQLARLELEFAPDTESRRHMVVHLSNSLEGIQRAQSAEDALIAAFPAVVEACIPTRAEGDPDNERLRLAMALGGPVIERIAKYRAAREKHALALIKELNAPARGRTIRTLEPMDEASCIAWLMRRFSAPTWRCPSCGECRGACLRVRAVWECAACRKQVSARAGTVMAGSHVPLGVWFAIIKILTERPETPGRQLARDFELRPQTAQGMRRRILAALDRPQQRHRLARLDELFDGHLRQASHSLSLPAPAAPGITLKTPDSLPEPAELPAGSGSPGDSPRT